MPQRARESQSESRRRACELEKALWGRVPANAAARRAADGEPSVLCSQVNRGKARWKDDPAILLLHQVYRPRGNRSLFWTMLEIAWRQNQRRERRGPLRLR